MILHSDEILVEWISDKDIGNVPRELAEDEAHLIGKVEAIGKYAFEDYTKYSPRPKVGEYILFNYHSAEPFANVTGKKMFLVTSNEIEAIIPNINIYYKARHYG